jgi:hypothetical protein
MYIKAENLCPERQVCIKVSTEKKHIFANIIATLESRSSDASLFIFVVYLTKLLVAQTT